MGNFLAGFLGKAASNFQEKEARSYAEKLKERQLKMDVLKSALNDPQINPDKVAEIYSQMGQLADEGVGGKKGKGKDGGGNAEKFGMLGKLFGALTQKKSGQQPGQPGQGGGGDQPMSEKPPAGVNLPGMNGAVPSMPALGGGGGVPQVPPVPGGQPSAQSAPGQVPPVPGRRGLIDPSMFQTAEQVDARALKNYKDKEAFLYDLRIKEDEAKAKAQAAAKATGAQAGRPYAGPAQSVESAKLLASQGKQYMDRSGQPISLENLPPDMGLKYFIQGDKEWYEPFDPNQSTVTIGNQVYAVGPWDKKHLREGAGVELGAKTAGTTTTRPSIGIDPATGKPVVNTLRSTRTPAAPGIPGRPSAQAQQVPPVPGAGGATPPGGTSTLAPARAGGATIPPVPGRAATPRPVGGDGASADAGLRGLPQGMYNQMLQRVTGVREANTQIFGDPTQPDSKSLKDYAALADNPQSRERLGKALQLTFDELHQAETANGSMMQLLKNYGGIPQALASSKSKIMQDAIGKLSPEERDAYDTTISSMSTVIGLRSLTKAPATQFSIRAIERELPIVGVNTTDSRQFYDKLAKLGEVVYNGTRGVPPGMFDPKEIEAIRRAPSELAKQKKAAPQDGQGGSPKVGPVPGTVEDGWRFKGGDPKDKSSWEKAK